MNLICPNCSSQMRISSRMGVEIDQCPSCKGVWLDRGELEKLTRIQERYEDDHFRNCHDGMDYDDDYYHRRKLKKKGFLGDLFDFD